MIQCPECGKWYKNYDKALECIENHEDDTPKKDVMVCKHCGAVNYKPNENKHCWQCLKMFNNR